MKGGNAAPAPGRAGLDQAVRYEQLTDLLRRRARRGLVLEVGAGPAGLRAWGWADPVVAVDLDQMPGLSLRADGRRLPFADATFTTTICTDVVEHVGPEDRRDLLAELRRVTRDLLVVAGPMGPTAEGTDRSLARWHRWARSPMAPWLEEHLAQVPYPEADQVSAVAGRPPAVDVTGCTAGFHWLLSMSQLLPRGWELGARLARRRLVRRALLRVATAGRRAYRRVLVYDLAPVAFSVIMPTYNRADDLEKAVESVLDQSFGDFELLIVDDGSTDATAEVVGRLARSNTKVRPIRLRRNTGSCGAARNAALPYARGSALAFCDDDVRWTPSHLGCCHEALTRAPACYTQARRLLPDGTFLDVVGEPWAPSGPAIGQVDANTLAVRREVMRPFKDTRGRYFTDDAELVARLHRSGVRFHFVPQATVDYKFNERSHAFVYSFTPEAGGTKVTARPRVRGLVATKARVAEALAVRIGRLGGHLHPADRNHGLGA